MNEEIPEDITSEVGEIIAWLKQEASKQQIPILFATMASYVSPLTITIPAATGSISGDISTKVEILQKLEDSWNNAKRTKRQLLLVPQSIV
jgi:hypothetical protein